MNCTSKTLLAAALGYSLLALEACKKRDTNRLAGRWDLQRGGLPFTFGPTTSSIIFDFDADGEFTEEITDIYFNDLAYTSYLDGDWKWAPGKKLEINIHFGYGYIQELRFEVVLIQRNNMYLKDRNDFDWKFKRE